MLLSQCPVCTELFNGESSISALVCGHVFHYACLNTWFSSNRSCPQCRTRVTSSSVIKHLYFDKADPNNTTIIEDVYTLNMEVKQLHNKLGERDIEIMTKVKEIQTLSTEASTMRMLYEEAQNHYDAENRKVKQLQSQLRYCAEEVEKAKSDIIESKQIKEKMTEMKHIQALINGEESQIEELLRELLQDKPPSIEIVRQLCKWLRVKAKTCDSIKADNKELKKKLDRYSKAKLKVATDLTAMQSKVHSIKKAYHEQKEFIGELEEEIHNLNQIRLNHSESNNKAFKRISRNCDTVIDLNTPEPEAKSRSTMIKSTSKGVLGDLNDDSLDMFLTPERPLESATNKKIILTSDEEDSRIQIRKEYALNPFKKTPKTKASNSKFLKTLNIMHRSPTTSNSLSHYPNGFGGRENAWSLKPSSKYAGVRERKKKKIVP